jgi:hypothetical protein
MVKGGIDLAEQRGIQRTYHSIGLASMGSWPSMKPPPATMTHMCFIGFKILNIYELISL